jgi:hypothetical protein
MAKQVVNAWDLMKVMGDPPTVDVEGYFDSEYQYRDARLRAEAKVRKFRDWDDLVKGTGITRWARSNGQYGGLWAPLAEFEKIADKGIEWRRTVRDENRRWVDAPKGTKLTWTEGRPCHKGGCPLVGTIEMTVNVARWNEPENLQPRLYCKRHASLTNKAMERKAAHEERNRLHREELDRRAEAERAAHEMAQRVVGALQSLDVARAEMLAGTDGDGRVTLTIDAADALLKAVEFTLEMEGL